MVTGKDRRSAAYVLDADQIVKTIERLQTRISARFPASGLGSVCADLKEVAQATAERAEALSRPYAGLRLLALLAVIIGVAAQVYFARIIDWVQVIQRADPVAVTQGLNAVVNLLVLAFAAIWFVLTLETRLKRRRVLRELYALRAMSHVIDMHQLTKDPSVELGNGTITSVSPERAMSDFQLSRYLDYCSELLALTGKLAALYAAKIQDREVVSAVNEIEALTTDLGRKIWQKIIIISNLEEHGSARN